MYQQHFGFREAPFSITPDPRFFYANSVYLEAYANLRYGIEAKKGFIAVTGEVGTGKTTLLRKLMLSLEQTIHTVFIFNTDVTFNELLRVILRDLGLPVAGKDRLSMVEELNDYLIEQLEHGQIVCLLIDEVQNLSDESLEGLRLLSNLETNQDKLLQIVLMGQPELQTKLDRPHLRQLKQRIAIRCEITRLQDQEVGCYIDFRLRAAGCQTDELFHREAVEKIAFYSKGIPRLINVICDNALLIAFAASQKSVSAQVIEEVAWDLKLAPGKHPIQSESNIPGSLSEARSEAFPQAAPLQNYQRKPKRWLSVAAPASVVVVVLIGFAAFTNPRRFTMDAGKSLAAYQKNLTEWALLVTGRKMIAPRSTARVASTGLQASPAVQKDESDIKSKDHRVTIQYGSTVFQIATDAYGTRAVLGMDLIKEFNPEIQNLNWISAGQDLLLPALTQETLLRQQTDGSFRLTVASFLSRREAEDFAQRIVREGFPVIVTEKRVSNNLLLHRLEIGGLKNLEDANQTIQIGFKNGWLPFTPKAINENQGHQAITGY
jgi:type II secretory pathway predicted ATPase ExeA